MPLFLYDLPNWVVGLLVSGVSVLFALAGYVLFRRLYRHEFDAEERELAMSVLGVVATINSLLLAFSAVSVWESFGDAEEAVVHEADTIAELSRDLAVFGSEESAQARLLLFDYAGVVINREWSAMRSGGAEMEAWRTIDSMFRAVGTIEPDTPRRTTLLPEIWARTNELLMHRRDRLHASQAEVPLTLWIVVFVGTVMTMLTTYVLPPTRFNLAMITSLALCMGLVFYFIIAMDHPFAGEESISSEPFQTAIDNMRRWDLESR
jgi:hypothetical protein